MNTRYFIQPGKVNKKGQSIVMLDLRWRGLRLKLSTGVQVEPRHFIDTPKQLLANGQENYLALNWKLKQLALDIERDYLLLEGQTKRVKEITVAMVDEMARKLLGTTKSVKASPPTKAGTNLWEIHTRWQELNRLNFSPGHLRHFEPALGWLAQYAPGLTLEELNEEWIQTYINWLIEHTTLRNGGMRGHIKLFKTMLKFGRLPHDWLVNPFTEHTPGIDLTFEEMMRVYNKEYFLPELRETADVYVFLCQVGLRWSDYLKLEKVETIQHPTLGRVLVILDQQQQKTKQPVTVALTPLAASIWTKYGGVMPKCTNQEFNRRLKQMGRIAELTRVIEHVTVRGKVYTTTSRPIWQILSAHTARHTCACLLLEGSGGTRLSQLSLGQANKVSTEIYARPKQLDQIAESLKAWSDVSKKH